MKDDIQRMWFRRVAAVLMICSISVGVVPQLNTYFFGKTQARR